MSHSPRSHVWLATTVDLLLVALAGWCLLPRLFGYGATELALPFGGRFTSSISPKHLLEFWALLFFRQLLGALSFAPSSVVRLVRDRSPAFQATLILVASIVVFLSIHRYVGSGDTIGAKLLPISILDEGDFDLDEFVGGIHRPHFYTLTRYGQHWYPTFPIAPSIAALPAFALIKVAFPQAYSEWRTAYSYPGGDSGPNPANEIEILAAAILSAISVLLVYLFANEVSGGRRSTSLWIAAAYGLGTPIMSTASGALWMHGPSCLFLAALCLAIRRSEERLSGCLFIAGVCGGVAFAVRPTNAIPVALLPLVLLIWRRKLPFAFATGAVLGALPFVSFNLWLNGNLLGAYGQLVGTTFGLPDPLILATILASPSRGLFVWSPYLLVAATLAALNVSRIRQDPLLLWLVLGAIASTLLVASFEVWTGGYSLGPRLLCETSLFLTLVLAFFTASIERSAIARLAVIALILLSAHIHIMATARTDRGWTRTVFNGVQDVSLFWSVSDSQLAWILR